MIVVPDPNLNGAPQRTVNKISYAVYLYTGMKEKVSKHNLYEASA